MRLFGHPLHPMLVHFPIAFWSLAAVSDGLVLAGLPSAGSYGGMAIALGLAMAVPAMLAGFADLAKLPEAAEKDGQRHMIFMGSAWSVFLIALMTRLDGFEPVSPPGTASAACCLFGFVLMAVGGWYGGKLVYEHGAGRRDRAGNA